MMWQWLRLFRTLSCWRSLNFLKLLLSYSLSVLRGSAQHWGVPVAVSIEPTTMCNLRCPECPTGNKMLKRQGGKLSLEEFEHILDSLPKETSWLTLYFQGEPYMNIHFFNMVRLAKQRRMFVATSSNGHFLDKENAKNTIDSGLDKIIISLDGSNAETYLSYRQGGDFEKVIEGIKTLARLKKEQKTNSPLLLIQFLVFRKNEHQIKDFTKLCRKLGADAVVFKTAQHYDYENGNPYMTSLDRYSRYRKTKSGKYKIKGKMHKRCWRMWSSCVITWDSSVVPCCYDKDAEFCYGNLLKADFKQIWEGKQAKKFRKKLWRSRNKIELCSNCHE